MLAVDYWPWNEPTWKNIITVLLIVLGLLITARLIAFSVRPRWKIPFGERFWLGWTWTGFFLLAWSATLWSDFAMESSTGAPARTVVTLVVAGAVLAGVLAAVLLPLLPGRPVPTTGIALATGVAFAVAFAPPWTAVVLARVVVPTPAVSYASASVVTVEGLLMFGLGLGSRLRLEVTVSRGDGARDNAATAYVVQRIQTMGSNKPRRLEAPGGTDVLTLPDQAVSAIPDDRGKLIAAVLAMLRALAAITPWRAKVLIVDEGTATVALSRNGSQLDSTLLFSSELGLDGSRQQVTGGARKRVEHELLTAAAAFVLLRLSDRHLTLMQGLYGASNWRSVACQVLADTPPWDSDSAAAEQLFATAVDKDPDNEAAWLGYLYYRSGCKVGTENGERRYVERLKQLSARLDSRKEDADDFVPLRMRVKHNLVVARWNHALLLGPESEKGQEERAAAGRDLGELQWLVEKAQKSPEDGAQEFAREMSRTVQIFKGAITNAQPDSAADGNMSLDDYYLRACLSAETGEAADLRRAADDLDLALGLRTLREEVPSDPSLARLRSDRQTGPEVMAMLDKPCLSDIALLEEHAKRLERDGIRYPDELLLRTVGEAAKELAESLDVPRSTIEAMRQVCWLVKCCPDQDQAVAWTDLLTREGIDTPQAVRQVFRDRKERERLRKRAWTVNASPLTDEVLLEWEYRLRWGLPVLA